MNRNALLQLSLTTALLLIPAVGNAAPSQTPTQVVKEFYNIVINRTDLDQTDKATQLSTSLRQRIGEVRTYEFPYCMDFDLWGGAQVGIDKFTVVGGEASKDKAQVDINVHRIGCDTVRVNVLLQTDNGEWKIDNILVPSEDINLRQLMERYSEDYEKSKK